MLKDPLIRCFSKQFLVSIIPEEREVVRLEWLKAAGMVWYPRLS